MGFEDGTFNNWELLEGTIDTFGILQNMGSFYSGNQHQIIERSPVVELDYYGKFPITSPNGSFYSARLGNDIPDRSAAQMNYTFQVPANTTGYSIIFNYAIVLENPPHASHQQPRMGVKVYNLTDNVYIECSSFDFVAGYSQPDFQISEVDPEIYFKPWSSVTLNLGAYKGKSLQLQFIVNDCTLGAHFGYAYVDVSQICSEPISGSYICPGFSNTSLQAPSGFRNYIWYTGNMSTQLGTGISLVLPNPVVGDSFAVVLEPYDYLGCRDTLETKIKVGGDPINLLVADSLVGCKTNGVNLMAASVTAGSTPGLILTYYNDAAGSQFVTNPSLVKEPGTYYIKGMNSTGCVMVKPVRVVLHDNPSFNVTDPPIISYPESVDLTRATDNPNLTYTYWMNFERTTPLLNPNMVQTTGQYYISAATSLGCRTSKPVYVRVKPKIYVPNAFTPNNDGKNDVFVYKASGGITGVEFFNIYNRWGQLIFSTNKKDEGWDGKFQGKLQPKGTYVYIFKIRDFFGTIHSEKGVVTLIY